MNDTFLHIVARDLLARFGNNMHNVTVVFPGKRAGLFLNQELASLSTEPVWTPRYLTIGDMFRHLSDYDFADPIECVCTLYQIYCEQIPEDEVETLDKFYGWGEVILSDFDDIDKHMAKAQKIFRNVYDLKQLEDYSFLEKEQADTLRKFFGNFNPEQNSEIKERFLRLWNSMFTLYEELNSRLKASGRSYEGAVFRHIAELLQDKDKALSEKLAAYGTTVFVGFNVLNQAEHTLMSELKKTQETLFYWDYDVFYTKDESHEAGTFMRQNLQEFSSALPEEYFDNLKNLRDVTFVSTHSDNIEARYVHTWLTGNKLNGQENRNAIVLCNEELLQPLLHSMPSMEEIQFRHGMNITMGYALKDTPVYGFIQSLFSLQTDGWDKSRLRFRHTFVQNVRNHPYYSFVDEDDCFTYQQGENSRIISYLIRLLEQVGKKFATTEEPDIYGQLNNEAIFQCHRILYQFHLLVSKTDNPLNVQPHTLRRLIRRVLTSASIPFHGEPATGLQIMGVLETRCLDFSHLLMLSTEENCLPRNSHISSMIPENIREAFHMTTQRHKICIYAYYFYRLIQRTSHVTCLYNENCTGISHHEISRFLRQLQAETNIPIRHQKVEMLPKTMPKDELTAKRTKENMQKLANKFLFDNPKEKHLILSPTAINTYLNCPIKFYLKYIAGIKANEDIADGVDAPLMGVIFHDAAQIIYTDLIGRNKGNRTLDNATLSNALKNKSYLEQMLDISFDANYFHPLEEKDKQDAMLKMAAQRKKIENEYTGELIIIRRVLLTYLNNLLTFDIRNAPILLLDMEKDYSICLPIKTPNGMLNLEVGGRIDRLDIVDGIVRIVDYKTGRPPKDTKKNMENVFQHDNKHIGYYLQTLLYSLAFKKSSEPQDIEGKMIQPHLIYVAQAKNEDYDSTLSLDDAKIEDFSNIEQEYSEKLTEVVNEIFDMSDTAAPFHQCSDPKACEHCEFKTICNR